DDHERCKSEAPTALDHLGHAVDVHELIDELAIALFPLAFTCHAWVPSWLGSFARNSLLEAQSAFAGGVGQCLDAAVKHEPAADLTARRTLASRRATALRSCAISSSRSFLLAFLAEHVLTSVLDPLALVRLGRPERADLGRDLSDFLAVDPGYHDLDRPRR